MEDDPGYPGGPKVITRGLIGGRQEGQSQRSDDRRSENATLLALKVEQGTISQGVQVTSKLDKMSKTN